jgi:hypothetical protein
LTLDAQQSCPAQSCMQRMQLGVVHMPVHMTSPQHTDGAAAWQARAASLDGEASLDGAASVGAASSGTK